MKKLLYFQIIFIISATLLTVFGLRYVQSDKFWGWLSKKSGFSIAGTPLDLQFYPSFKIELDHLKLESYLEFKKLKLVFDRSAMLGGNLKFELALDDLNIDRKLLELNKNEKPEPLNLRWIVPRYKQVEAKILVDNLRLPISESHSAPVRVMADVFAKGGLDGFDIRINRLSTLGFQMEGNIVSRDPRELNFDFRLPAKVSVMSGTFKGKYFKNYLDLAAKFRAPKIRIPSGVVNSIPALKKAGISVRGNAFMALAGKLDVKGGAWDADVRYGLNFTDSLIEYLEYEKPAGVELKGKGHLFGTGTKWEIKDAEFQMINAKMKVHYENEALERIKVEIPAFNLSEWSPLLRKISKQSVTPQGVISGNAKLTLVSDEFSGNVALSANKLRMDAKIFSPFIRDSEFAIVGPLEVDGGVEFEVEKNKVLGGAANLDLDYSATALRYSTVLSKYASKEKGLWRLKVDGSTDGTEFKFKDFIFFFPENSNLRLFGKIDNKLNADLQIHRSRVSLSFMNEMFPVVKNMGGMAILSGKLLGDLNHPEKLKIDVDANLKNALLETQDYAFKKMNGSLIFGKTGVTRKLVLKPLSFEYRTKLASKFAKINAKGASVMDVQRDIIRGQYNLSHYGLDLRPYLNRDLGVKQSPKNMAEKNKAKSYFADVPFNLENSELILDLESRYLRTDALYLRNAKSKIVIGSGGENSNAPLRIASLRASTLGGKIDFSGQVDSQGEFKFGGKGGGLALSQLSKLMAKFSEQKIGATFFGRSAFNFKGEVDLTTGFDSLEISGGANVANGAYYFLPMPKRIWPQVFSRFSSKKAGPPKGITNSYRSASATFAYKHKKVDLKVEADGDFLAMNSTGYFDLDGSCEFQGIIRPKAKFTRRTLNFMLEQKVPFKSEGKKWDCRVQPDFRELANRQVKRVSKKANASPKKLTKRQKLKAAAASPMIAESEAKEGKSSGVSNNPVNSKLKALNSRKNVQATKPTKTDSSDETNKSAADKELDQVFKGIFE